MDGSPSDGVYLSSNGSALSYISLVVPDVPDLHLDSGVRESSLREVEDDLVRGTEIGSDRLLDYSAMDPGSISRRGSFFPNPSALASSHVVRSPPRRPIPDERSRVGDGPLVCPAALGHDGRSLGSHRLSTAVDAVAFPGGFHCYSYSVVMFKHHIGTSNNCSDVAMPDSSVGSVSARSALQSVIRRSRWVRLPEEDTYTATLSAIPVGQAGTSIASCDVSVASSGFEQSPSETLPFSVAPRPATVPGHGSSARTAVESFQGDFIVATRYSDAPDVVQSVLTEPAPSPALAADNVTNYLGSPPIPEIISLSATHLDAAAEWIGVLDKNADSASDVASRLSYVDGLPAIRSDRISFDRSSEKSIGPAERSRHAVSRTSSIVWSEGDEWGGVQGKGFVAGSDRLSVQGGVYHSAVSMRSNIPAVQSQGEEWGGMEDMEVELDSDHASIGALGPTASQQNPSVDRHISELP